MFIDVVGDVVPFPECSRRFSDFFNNDSNSSKRKIKQNDILSPSLSQISPNNDNYAKVTAKVETSSMQFPRVTF